MIFACVTHAGEYTDALTAGANFLLRKPLNEDSIALHITIAKELLERERRRYFRHAVNLPALLKDREVEQHARLKRWRESSCRFFMERDENIWSPGLPRRSSLLTRRMTRISKQELPKNAEKHFC